MKRLVLSFWIAGLVTSSAVAYDITPEAIEAHIRVLASDSLEGREAGEPGEWKAAHYISGVMKSAGLVPGGPADEWYQAFDFIKKIELGEDNLLVVNGAELVPHEEFKPLKASASAEFDFDEIVFVDYGITTEDSAYDDYDGKDVAGKAVVIKRHAPSSETNPHIDFDRYASLTDKMIRAIDHGATGIFFYTPESHDDTMITIGGAHVTPKDIPIIWLRRSAFERLGLDLTRPQLDSARGDIDLIPVHDTAYNVAGVVPSDNDTMIIIGAHYDHLGYGGLSSLYPGKEPKIHYGADDNGSGVAALLELARKISDSRDQLKYSYAFVAFTGEEKGLLGSSHYVDDLGVDTSKVRLMINMDMIGRLKDQENGLAIFGTGTADELKSHFDTLEVESIKITVRESGAGPSDHTAFYNMNIPVLHFFTGAHEDYHKPADIVDKVDFEGVTHVADLVYDIATHFDQHPGEMAFQKTKDDQPGRQRAAYSVTLGIMPDYIYDGYGLKIDGVSGTGPAERAGLQKDDVIIRMGDWDVDDIYAYMNALSKYRKGDTTDVVVLRGTDTLQVEVDFN